MSDYLSNLIARSFNLTEVIQPRLPSLFEPSQQSGEPIVEQFLELERENRTVQSPRANLSSPPQLLEPNSLDPVSADLRPATFAQVIAGEGVPPPSPIEQLPTPEQTAQQQVVEQVNVPVETPSTANPRSESPLVPKGVAPRQASPVIQPQITPLPELVASSVPITRTDPPTIQVTIGRVDVRAITPASPPRQPNKPPTPNLSLEDYLKSRSGGRG